MPQHVAINSKYMMLPSKKVLCARCICQAAKLSAGIIAYATTCQLLCCHSGFVLQDLRSMVAHLSGTDLAVAGHAVALAGWHQVQYVCCDQCASRQPSIERLPTACAIGTHAQTSAASRAHHSVHAGLRRCHSMRAYSCCTAACTCPSKHACKMLLQQPCFV